MIFMVRFCLLPMVSFALSKQENVVKFLLNNKILDLSEWETLAEKKINLKKCKFVMKRVKTL